MTVCGFVFNQLQYNNCSHQCYLPEQVFTLTMYNYNSCMGQNPQLKTFLFAQAFL